MSPDPGVEDSSPVVTTSTSPPETTTTSSDTSMESQTVTTSQTGEASTSTLPRTSTGQRSRQRTVAEEASADLGPCPGPSTFSTSLQGPNPRRHRQRLANHYLNQIRSTQQQSAVSVPGPSGHSRSATTTTTSSTPPFHHYYHPYHQHHHHQHLHYPTYPHGYYSRTPAALAAGTLPLRGSSRGTRGSSERSPFLMVKILLFSLMTIDFVMNSIGLAVIAVMAKNHFANLAVERSLHPPPPLEPSAPLPEDPYHRTVYSHPYAGAANEWTILLPLLPSFLFVELLTLVGMFGVFADSFAFVMTYAILKLITSLCYPSMASAAAVAAMATVTSTPSASVGQGSIVNSGGVGVGSITPGFHPNQASQSSLVPSILPLPLPENFTAFLSQARYLSLNNRSAHSGVTPIDTTTTLPPTNWPSWMNPTTPLSFETPTTPFFDSSLPPTTTLATQSPPPATTTAATSNHLDPDETSSKSYKHSRLKHDKLMAAMKTAKKIDKMAKLKAREKQLRSKLLRLESAESSPSNWTLPSSAAASHARVSLLLPPTSASLDPAVTSSSFNNAHSNIKYHHRVWDALLVTFEVIFAVAFAFNTLTSTSRRDVGEDSDEEEAVGSSGEGLGRTRRRIRRFRSSRGGGYHWPYSPLATSVDAFYFAQYQLPPPPPPYFGAAQLTQGAGLRPAQRSASDRHSASSPSSNPIPNLRRSHRSLLDYTANWRRFTPSWLRAPPQQLPTAAGPLPRLSPTPSLRSLPPLYEDIHHDDPVTYFERHIRQTLPNDPETPTSNDRTILQMSTTITEATVPRPARRSPRRSATPLRDVTELAESTPPESPNLKSKSQTAPSPSSSESNITSIKVPESATATSAVPEASKTLVLAINQNDTRV